MHHIGFSQFMRIPGKPMGAGARHVCDGQGGAAVAAPMKTGGVEIYVRQPASSVNCPNYTLNSKSLYVGNGQASLATSGSISSATARSASMAGLTLSR